MESADMQCRTIVDHWLLEGSNVELAVEIHGCGCGCGCGGGCASCGCGDCSACSQCSDSDPGDDDTTTSPAEQASAHNIAVKTGENGADISDLSVNITSTFDDISTALSAHSPNITPTITSGTDGTHMEGSKHYSGDAIDLISHNLSANQTNAIIDDLESKLGSDYDIINEGSHIHIEYDSE